VISFMPWLLYPQGKSPRYPLDKWLGGPQRWSEHSGEKKKNPITAPAGNQTLVILPVA